VLPPNGWRYPLVGGTSERHFDGTSLKPRKLPKNAATPTSVAWRRGDIGCTLCWADFDNYALLNLIY